jgi:hypothetical protein
MNNYKVEVIYKLTESINKPIYFLIQSETPEEASQIVANSIASNTSIRKFNYNNVIYSIPTNEGVVGSVTIEI